MHPPRSFLTEPLIYLLKAICVIEAIALGGCRRAPAVVAPQRPIELAGNLGALLNPVIPASSYTFHGIKLGDPIAAVLSAPGADCHGPANPDCLVSVPEWGVDFESVQGKITSINIFDDGPSKTLQDALEFHNLRQTDPEKIKSRFGVGAEDIPTDCGFYFQYPKRHIRVFFYNCGPGASEYFAVKLTQ